MANILNFNPDFYFSFFLVLLRVSGIFITAPILSSDTVPRQIRVYMALICSLIMFNVLPTIESVNNLTVADFLLISVRETMIGLLLGVVPKIMFAAIEFAGTLIGFQMGLSVANVVDPQTDVQVSIVASFENVLATLLFVVLDGHHIFFEVLSVSYQKIPINGFVFSPNKIDFLLRIMADLFIIGLKLGAPLIVALLLANVIMGFMARSIPQLNVFVVGFPFTIGLGLLFLALGVPYMVRAITILFETTAQQVLELLTLMAK